MKITTRKCSQCTTYLKHHLKGRSGIDLAAGEINPGQINIILIKVDKLNVVARLIRMGY